MPCSRSVFAALLVALMLPTATFAGTWVRNYGGESGFSQAWAVRPTHDGGFVVAGRTSSFGAPANDWWVLKLFASGNVQWERTFGGDANDLPNAVVQAVDGGYLVAGYTASLGQGANDAWMIRLDGDGNVLWQRVLGTSGWESLTGVVPSADGGFALVGSVDSRGAVMKVDAAGNTVWHNTYTDSGGLSDIASTDDGGFVAAGSLGDGGWVVRLDGAGGVLWQKSYVFDLRASFTAVDVSADGSILVGGHDRFDSNGQPRDFLLLRLDGGGDVQWAKGYGDPARPGERSDELRSIDATDDGGLVAIGSTDYGSLSRFNDMWVIKLHADGSPDWQRRMGGDAQDHGMDVAQIADGGYILAGQTSSFGQPGGPRLWLLRLDPLGIATLTCAAGSGVQVGPQNAAVAVSATTETVTPAMVTGSETNVTGTDTAAAVDLQCLGAPGEVSPPGALQPLRFASASDLTWEDGFANNAATFNLYRGDLDALGSPGAPVCFDSGLASPGGSDPASPASPGSGWFYLVTGVNAAGEGTLGFESAGERQNESPCP